MNRIKIFLNQDNPYYKIKTNFRKISMHAIIMKLTNLINSSINTLNLILIKIIRMNAINAMVQKSNRMENHAKNVFIQIYTVRKNV